MADSEPAVKKPDFAKDLLLADHKYIGELLQKNEQGGETRVNLFITLIVAGIGGLFALFSKEGMGYDKPRLLIIVTIIFLLVIGTVTWLRMIKRDTTTDRFARQLDIIRRTFKQQCDNVGALADYDPFPRMNLGGKIRRFGGLGDTVAVLNGFLAAGLAAALVLSDASTLSDGTMLGLASVIATIFGVAVATIQVSYANNTEGATREKLGAFLGAPSHAGGVVYEMCDGDPRYLLVSAKNNPEEWVLPQGHIEPNEDHAEAALREVREEANIVSATLGFACRVQFKKYDGIQDAKFYLMKKIGDVGPLHKKEKREICWLPIDKALAALKYKESREVMQKADEVRKWLQAMAKGDNRI